MIHGSSRQGDGLPRYANGRPILSGRTTVPATGFSMISRDQCFDGVNYPEYRDAPALCCSMLDEIVGSLPI